MGKYIFEIEGHIVPCQRVNAKGKYAPRAVRYHNSQEAIRWQLRAQMIGKDMIPEGNILHININIEVSKCLHCADADNLGKALIDAAQGIVFKNDSHVDSLSIVRMLTNRDFAVMEIEDYG